MTTLVFVPEIIVGYTEVKKSSCMFLGTNANSSRYKKLIENPRIAVEAVDAAIATHPFSNSIFVLFQLTTPCCSHGGKFSNALCTRVRISLDVESLLARIATL